MIDPHADPTLVGGLVIDTVRGDLAQFLITSARNILTELIGGGVLNEGVAEVTSDVFGEVEQLPHKPLDA